jgi:adenylylsulfate kinase
VIVVVCGPPGAGKTTLSTALRDRLAAEGARFELVHSDDFSRRTYDRMYERVAVEPAADWIVDGTFYRRAWRERFESLGDVRFASLRASLDTCLRRNRERDEPIDERGVYVVHAEFEEFDADLTLDTDSLPVDETLDRLVAAVLRWRSAGRDEPRSG